MMSLLPTEPRITKNEFDDAQCRCSKCNPFASRCCYCLDQPNRERHREKMESIKVKTYASIVGRQHATEQSVRVFNGLTDKGLEIKKIELNWSESGKIDQKSNMDGTNSGGISGEPKVNVSANMNSTNNNNYHSIDDDGGTLKVTLETWEPLRHRNVTSREALT